MLIQKGGGGGSFSLLDREREEKGEGNALPLEGCWGDATEDSKSTLGEEGRKRKRRDILFLRVKSCRHLHGEGKGGGIFLQEGKRGKTIGHSCLCMGMRRGRISRLIKGRGGSTISAGKDLDGGGGKENRAPMGGKGFATENKSYQCGAVGDVPFSMI